jgi:hypothetical protein
MALAVCRPEAMAHRFQPLDTTRFARRGDDMAERAEPAIAITHGYATDHWPD